MLQMSVEIIPNLNYKTFEGRLNSLNRQIKKMDDQKLLNHLTITGKVFKSPTPITETNIKIMIIFTMRILNKERCKKVCFNCKPIIRWLI